MISTDLQRVQIQDIVEHQLPSFVRSDFPLIADFLKQYYISQEYPGGSVDLIQNIDEYLKLESLTNNATSTTLLQDVSYTDTTLTLTFNLNKEIFGTYEFPEKYGLLKIDDEIILYTGKTNNKFTGCIRGFSGVTSYTHLDARDRLTFDNSKIATHKKDAVVTNLSALLFNEFLTKVKYQISPGFEKRSLDSDIDQKLFLSRAKDFYASKGTDESFKILFGVLYGETVEVLKPREYLFRPSNSEYRVTKDLVVESITGDPNQLLNQTLFQDAYVGYGISYSYASVTGTELLKVDGKDFYKLSVDYDYDKDIDLEGSLLGVFSVHPQTKVITQVSSGASIITVDSTVGFAQSGELVATYSSGVTGIISYTSASVNQFFGVTGITSIIPPAQDIRLNVYAYGYVGIGTTTRIDVRVGSVLAQTEINEDTYYFTKDDTAQIKCLGITTSGPRLSSWIYNVASRFDVESLTLIDESDWTYRVVTYAPNNYRVGDILVIESNLGETEVQIVEDKLDPDAELSDITNEYTFSIRGQGQLSGSNFAVKRRISRPSVESTLTNYQYLSKDFANIQNTYAKFNKDVIVTAPSLPSYFQQPLDFYDRTVTLDGSYSGETFTVSGVTDHGYYTGDSVYYNKYLISGGGTEQDSPPPVYSKFEEMEEGVFFIKRLNSTQFKLSTSQANLYNATYVSVSGIVTSNTLTYVDYEGKALEQQHLVREILAPNNESGDYPTDPGKTGILINGVEILNYKADDTVYYGTLDEIKITSSGEKYDIINPPLLSISDDLGVGATGKVAVTGSLERIEITDTGFDYVDQPVITITGGNGSGATATVNLKSIDHSVSFDATATAARVDTAASTIGFSTYHKFRNAEKVIYKTDGQEAVAGLSTDALYYVQTVDASTIKLYPTEGTAVAGSASTVALTGFGVGVHRIEGFNKKKVVSNIGIDDSGSGYQNKERSISYSGINTASNEININDHGYLTGEIINYTFDATKVDGLSVDTPYVVTAVNKDNFKLSSVGVGTTSKFFFSDNELYVDLLSTGSGYHTFNYEPISVVISGEIGVTTFSGQNFNAAIQPVFRGSIDSIQVTSSGVGYGSSEILNYNRQPSFNLLSGEDAELLPIVNNGQIVEVLVTKGGSGYNSPPDLTINGAGKYGKLVPILSGGEIVSVRVDQPGVDYTDDTTVTITASGLNGEFEADLQKWTINYFEKYLPIISADDGILDGALNEEFGIQYTHLYAPIKLRQIVYGKTQDDDVKFGIFDLRTVNGEEIPSTYHSPIIGWAYDGNPIYGPYGFASKTGGIVKAMESGYEITTVVNRPPLANYSQGFFVEDFVYTGAGDLDEYNGRFCITPDYPNGTYAYFATISNGPIENSGPFRNYKIPVFPYLIGNKFKSKPNSFNFQYSSNQFNYNFNDSEWFRNTTPYSLTEPNAYYDYLYQPNKKKTQTIDLPHTSTGTIDNVGILTGGTGYQVGDKIVFEPLRNTQSAKAKVTEILGELVTDVSVATTTTSNLEIAPYDSNGSYIAIATAPHNLTNNNLVSLVGFNTSIDHLQSSFNIGISTETLTLSSGVGTEGITGIVTYFSVLGSLFDDLLSVRENDILGIGLTEKVKVLNVDKENSRIRVLRAQQNTVSTAHTDSTAIKGDTRKFTFTSLPENAVQFELNKEIYFKPSEALGLSVTGIGTTISFVNPGAGLTEIFVPSQSIYLPGHELTSGDILTYQNNSGDSIGVSTDGTTSFNIPNSQPLYVGRISKDLIGISTFKVGVGSTGTFVGSATTTEGRGLLYFTGIGTKDYHSFKTEKEKVVTAESTKNIVTVATAATHGLQLANNITITVKPVTTNTVTVKYDDYNRRIVFNPVGFNTSDVDTTQNTISVADHGWENGTKVIHTATSPSTGLSDEGMYYVRRYSKDKVKLCNSKYESLRFTPEIVDITAASSGTLSPVNPSLNAYENQDIKFDLSDSSLSSTVGLTSYSAFEFNLYEDQGFTNEFDSSSHTTSFEVSKTGEVGKTSDAALTLKVSDYVPQKLYYKFTPINPTFISDAKKEIYIDTEVVDYNQIEKVDSSYSGTFNITGIGVTSIFNYDIKDIPESSSYTSTTAKLSYITDSTSAYGGISSIRLNYKGNGYYRTVGVSTVSGISTTSRSGSILKPESTTIGSINSTKIENIGFNYPTDNTLRPVLNLPEILTVEPLTSFSSIGITSAGKDYTIAPSLVVIDGFTGKEVPGVHLRYDIGDTEVQIVQNTNGIYNTPPTILPTNNSNGVGIATITYDISTNEVTVGMNTGFSDSFPFNVGDKVLVENIAVGVGSTGYGYNSFDYGYSLFTLTEVFPNLGGVGIVTYSLEGYLPYGQYPGAMDTLNSAGRIIPEKDFPQFDINLKRNDFILGETVTSGSNTGVVESWNSQIELLKVSTRKDFSLENLVVGETSKTQGRIKSKIDFNAQVRLNATSIVKQGFSQETGFLNSNIQRLPDNNYYQNFSYSLKSKVDLEKWDDAVNTLNHTSGFLKFSDLILESQDETFKGVVTDYNATVDVTVDLQNEIHVDCYAAFDLVTENALTIGSRKVSDKIYLNSRVLTDYYESFGNRVLTIDDIGSQFNSEPRATICMTVDRFPIAERYKKYFTYVNDKRYTAERQFMIVSLLQDQSSGWMNQYARVESVLDLGSFDFSRAGSEGQLTFCPTKYKVNDYNVSNASFSLVGLSTLAGGEMPLGTVVDLETEEVNVATGTPTTVVGIASTYRSAKVQIEIDGDNGVLEVDEFNVIHDGSTVDLVEYGQLTSYSGGSGSGLGTYGVSMSSGPIEVTFYPNAGVAATVNSLRVAIADTATGVGTTVLGIGVENIAFMDCAYTSIASTSSPTENVVASYEHTGDDDYACAYYVVQISDTTNGRYEMDEVAVLNDTSEAFITQWGTLTTVAGLGTIGASVGSTTTDLLFTPLAGIDAEVRVFQVGIQLVSVTTRVSSSIDLNNWSIGAGYGFYEGTETGIKRAFSLDYNQRPIFMRDFDGSSSAVVDLTANTIQIPEHYFVSGEELNYRFADTAIGIATTTFAGIGSTSLLPQSSVYVIDIDDTTIKLARSAEDALSTTPVPLDITHVGIGTSHTFIARNPNNKCLIALDNAIQSPVVATATTTGLTSSITLVDNILKFSGITSFFGGDLIQVDNEVMKINTIGIGSTNHILVDREWMGTGLATHAPTATVYKVEGSYNIVDSTINFYTAPQGPTPISTTSNPPDDRDWVGITTSSTFQGRSFMRSGEENSTEETYVDNYMFDDISDQFNAVDKVFTLTSDNQNIAGFSTNNSIILVNGIFQGPTGELAIPQDYDLTEVSGITSITFTGTATSLASDPQNATIPVGGIIVSVGSSSGWGYQPLVAAGGTALVSTAGTINSITIGNTGSGYRSGIQTVTVGIQTASLGIAGITSIGIAAVSDGYVTGVTINNPQVFYKPRDIVNVGYSSITGITTITTATDHGLKVGEEVQLSGIAFTCAYAPIVGIQSAAYDNTSGIMTVTTSTAHGLSVTGNSSNVVLTGLAFTCAIDAGVSTHIYPRNRDRVYDTSIPITSIAGTTITVNVTTAKASEQYTHSFVSAATSAVISGGAYSHAFRYATSGAITANTGVGYTPTTATYDALTGDMVLTMPSHGLTVSNTVSIATSSLVFACEMDQYGSDHAYPRSTDPVAGISTAITGTSTDTITVNVGTSPLVYFNVGGATYDAATGDMVLSIGTHTLTTGTSIKIAKESLSFKCSRDSYATIHKYPREGDPTYGGVAVAGVASATQFSVNVGVATVPTFYQSGGTVQAAIIAPRAVNNSDTGTDPATNGSSIITVLNTTSFEVDTGISTRPHFYNRGGKVEMPMEVVFDTPLSYTNIPLIYSDTSPAGFGTQATIDVVVGQGSSVVDFEVRNTGYGYGQNQILTVPIGGTTGIPTDTSLTFDEFNITIQRTETDKFAGWNVGELLVLDKIQDQFNGNKKVFTLQQNSSPITIRSAVGSNIDVQATLLVFVNDTLQVPGEGYIFEGGSVITFAEAPKSGDTCKILFYKGSGDTDVTFKDVLETIKVGDTLSIQGDKTLCANSLDEDKRLAIDIYSSDTVTTNPYDGVGINDSSDCKRSLTWCKQKADKIINGKIVGKSREINEAWLFPTTNIIQSVGVGSTVAYVTSLKPFFDSVQENQTTKNTYDIALISQDSIVSASGTATVSTGGTVSAIGVVEGGSGYVTAPAVTISNPVGLGSTYRANASATLTGDAVSAITVTTPGSGYISTDVPQVLIESPQLIREKNRASTYSGDFGEIVGITTTTVGVASTGLVLDFHIPNDSPLRNSSYVSGVTTISNIVAGDYFIIEGSNIGNGVTSLYQGGSVLGIGTTFLDGIYEVAAVSVATTAIPGLAVTYVARVTTSISDFNGLTGTGYSSFFGEFSLGKIQLGSRSVPQSFTAYTDKGVTGIITGGIVNRIEPLRYVGYLTT